MSYEVMRNLLLALTAVVGLICLVLMALVLWASRKSDRARMIQNRLGIADESMEGSRALRLWLDGKEIETSVARNATADIASRFSFLCRDAGWEAPPQTILIGLIGAMCGAFAIALITSHSMIAGGGAAAITVTAFWLYLNHRINRRRGLFEAQLIDALELAARSLRVGHPLVSSFRLISEEVSAPIGPIFGNIVQQQELGAPLDEAIRQAARSSSSEDLKLFATAVIIQLKSGGNLADMMERVANVMRDRLRLARRVRVLIAQTQFSKQVLLALPFFMFFVLYWLNPDYMRPLYTTHAGRIILGAAALGLAVGTFLMNRLAIIRY